MKRRGKYCRRRTRRGGSLVEMALVAPILVMLTFGAIQYGYYIYVKNQMYGAASNGAAEASLSTSTNTTVSSAVTTAMTNANLQNTSYTVSTNPSSVSGLPSGTSVSVTVSLNWGNVGISPLPTALGGIASTKTITATATMRRQ